jgi:hypothetical protein
MRHKIVKANVMVERIGPKVGAKVGTGGHGTESVANGLMRAFTRAVLVRGVRAGQLDLVAKVTKGVVDFAALAKFANAVHADVLVWTRGCVTAATG